MDNILNKFDEYSRIRSMTNSEYIHYYSNCTLEELENERKRIKKMNDEIVFIREKRVKKRNIPWNGSLINRFNWEN